MEDPNLAERDFDKSLKHGKNIAEVSVSRP